MKIIEGNKFRIERKHLASKKIILKRTSNKFYNEINITHYIYMQGVFVYGAILLLRL